ncbi:MAG: FtsW/RodA/SpoVE family cell cycle protein [Lactobacillus iners]|nr:FtsW/RodA/SpoVE family cell cycle protein [Lactobacillus iners]MCT7811017.1 FtsW/RodA/SpoVE family cell cycle protein [Lactobacillus iners]MCT7838211.1 FtsW/RodA/SpoVE family cell cycle protein [Lactobacillus iners]MCT7865470.1 FtsW/RodA/SpoVE family cell cycle protein [Lactobacillus iners]
MRQKLKYLDYSILIPYLLLSLFGIVMIYSASSDILLVNGFSPMVYMRKQIINFILAFFALGVPFFTIKLELLKRLNFVFIFLVIAIAMLFFLIVLKIVSHGQAEINGAVGWIKVGPINVQPVEFAKLALIFYLAFVLSKKDGYLIPGKIIENLKKPTMLVGLMLFLTILEPDFGGTSILFLIVCIMYSVSGMPIKYAVGGLLILLFAVLAIVFLLLHFKPAFITKYYQFQRLLAFAHPFELEKTSGGQLVNSYYAIHNGGLFGVGIGNSMQKRGYLPEPYTDFILSIISEELGSIGGIAVVAILFFLVWRITEVGLHTQNQFNSLLCFGIATIIFTETFFNVGAVLGMLPITGVTLPFISYGGSSIMALTAAVAVVLNIEANEKIMRARKDILNGVSFSR